VNGLAVALLGVAALCADRVARTASRGRILPGAPGEPELGGRERRIHLGVRALLLPLAIGCAGLVVAGPLGGLAGAAGALAGRRIRGHRGRKGLANRRDEQLADAIGALTAAVRSGMSVPQAIAYAMREAGSPVRDDLARVVADIEVGVPLGEAIDAWAERSQSRDVQLVAGALDLHRRSGGDHPAVLDQVAATIRERVAVGREVRALTAQARLSGWILGVLPVGFFAFLWLTSRRDIEGALGTPAGLASVLLGLGLEVGAFFWIRSLLEVA
jgi:tight adherence protein B